MSADRTCHICEAVTADYWCPVCGHSSDGTHVSEPARAARQRSRMVDLVDEVGPQLRDDVHSVVLSHVEARRAVDALRTEAAYWASVTIGQGTAQNETQARALADEIERRIGDPA